MSILLAGSIPACAGEPHKYAALVLAGGVYPRVCGGTRLAEFSISCRRGLSPRVRGNQKLRDFNERYERSIPACAGEP